MEAPDDDEEMDPMSSEPHDKPHQPEAEEPILNLSKMADLAEGGELHVGQLDLHTKQNRDTSFLYWPYSTQRLGTTLTTKNCSTRRKHWSRSYDTKSAKSGGAQFLAMAEDG